MNNMSDKLNKLILYELNSRGWSQRELSRRAHVSHGYVSEILSDKRVPSYDFCASIAWVLGKTPEEMFRVAGLSPQPPEASPGEAELLDNYRRLDETGRYQIREFTRTMRETKNSYKINGGTNE